MSSTIRAARHALFVLAVFAAGCGESAEQSSTVSSGEPAPSPSSTATATSPATEGASAKPETSSAAAPAKEKEADADGAVKLEKVKFDEFARRMANKNAKYTLVDVWATWCAPCKENFPHVVEMHKKYSGKGLAVASLSFDDPTEAKQVHAAQEFLAEKKAVMANYLLDEEQGVGNEKLNVNSIPAVFIYGPDGKEVKRFTWDDPDNQFTYEEVEETVAALLDGKPLPQPKPAAKPKASEK
jgi:thiol-disulfide isomerase/thioredoxin